MRRLLSFWSSAQLCWIRKLRHPSGRIKHQWHDMRANPSEPISWVVAWRGPKQIPTLQNHTACLAAVLYRWEQWDWFNGTACYDLMVKKPEDWPMTLIDGASKPLQTQAIPWQYPQFPRKKCHSISVACFVILWVFDHQRISFACQIYSHQPEVKWAGGSPRLYDGRYSARAGVAGILLVRQID